MHAQKPIRKEVFHECKNIFIQYSYEFPGNEI